MGITISHPITLLLFKDTIFSAIEEDRQKEVEEVRVAANKEKKNVETKIDEMEAEIATRREEFNATLSAEFLVEDTSVGEADPIAALDDELCAQMEDRIAADTAAYTLKIESINADFAEM